MPLDQPDETAVVNHTRKSGEGALPATLLTKLRDMGIGCSWTIQLQETDAMRKAVQINFYETLPGPPV